MDYHSHSCDFFLIEKYGPWDQNIWQYPEILEVRYPKVGEVNPINSLWLTDLKNGKWTVVCLHFFSFLFTFFLSAVCLHL